MKKILTLLLCLCFLFALASCKQNTSINFVEEDELAGTSDTYGHVEVSATKDAYNMLTGENNMPSDRIGLRPYCISVNNIADSWPQKGTSAADIVIEMETEGGITRLMCLYNDTREVALIGSERSLRDQFIEAIFPVDPIIVHIGTSIFADKALAEHNMRSIDGDILPGSIYVDRVRMQTYATEHCKFTSGKLIYDTMQAKRFDEKSSATIKSYFNFAAPDETVELTGGAATKVNFDFSGAGYDGDFRYDTATGLYQKFQRNQPQMDAGENADGTPTNKQLEFKNVIVLFANIINRPDHPDLINVDYQAGGTGYYFSNGTYEEFHWYKGDYTAAFEFTKADGTPLVINTGKSMLCMVRTDYLDTLKIA